MSPPVKLSAQQNGRCCIVSQSSETYYVDPTQKLPIVRNPAALARLLEQLKSTSFNKAEAGNTLTAASIEGHQTLENVTCSVDVTSFGYEATVSATGSTSVAGSCASSGGQGSCAGGSSGAKGGGAHCVASDKAVTYQQLRQQFSKQFPPLVSAAAVHGKGGSGGSVSHAGTTPPAGASRRSLRISNAAASAAEAQGTVATLSSTTAQLTGYEETANIKVPEWTTAASAITLTTSGIGTASGPVSLSSGFGTIQSSVAGRSNGLGRGEVRGLNPRVKDVKGSITCEKQPRDALVLTEPFPSTPAGVPSYESIRYHRGVFYLVRPVLTEPPTVQNSCVKSEENGDCAVGNVKASLEWTPNDEETAVELSLDEVAALLMIPPGSLTKIKNNHRCAPSPSLSIDHKPYFRYSPAKDSTLLRVFGQASVTYTAKLEDYVFLIDLICRTACSLNRPITFSQIRALLSQRAQQRNCPKLQQQTGGSDTSSLCQESKRTFTSSGVSHWSAHDASQLGRFGRSRAAFWGQGVGEVVGRTAVGGPVEGVTVTTNAGAYAGPSWADHASRYSGHGGTSSWPPALTAMSNSMILAYQKLMGPFITDEVFVYLMHMLEVLSEPRDTLVFEVALAEARSQLSILAPSPRILREVFSYWRSQRTALRKPLLREFWPVPSASDSSPFAVFRARTKEKMVLRRPRRNAVDTGSRLEKVVYELAIAQRLTAACDRRDSLKMHLAQLDACLFEQLCKETIDPDYTHPLWMAERGQTFGLYVRRLGNDVMLATDKVAESAQDVARDSVSVSRFNFDSKPAATLSSQKEAQTVESSDSYLVETKGATTVTSPGNDDILHKPLLKRRRLVDTGGILSCLNGSSTNGLNLTLPGQTTEKKEDGVGDWSEHKDDESSFIPPSTRRRSRRVPVYYSIPVSQRYNKGSLIPQPQPLGPLDTAQRSSSLFYIRLGSAISYQDPLPSETIKDTLEKRRPIAMKESHRDGVSMEPLEISSALYHDDTGKLPLTNALKPPDGDGPCSSLHFSSSVTPSPVTGNSDTPMCLSIPNEAEKDPELRHASPRIACSAAPTLSTPLANAPLATLSSPVLPHDLQPSLSEGPVEKAPVKIGASFVELPQNRRESHCVSSLPLASSPQSSQGFPSLAYVSPVSLTPVKICTALSSDPSHTVVRDGKRSTFNDSEGEKQPPNHPHHAPPLKQARIEGGSLTCKETSLSLLPASCPTGVPLATEYLPALLSSDPVGFVNLQRSSPVCSGFKGVSHSRNEMAYSPQHHHHHHHHHHSSSSTASSFLRCQSLITSFPPPSLSEVLASAFSDIPVSQGGSCVADIVSSNISMHRTQPWSLGAGGTTSTAEVYRQMVPKLHPAIRHPANARCVVVGGEVPHDIGPWNGQCEDTFLESQNATPASWFKRSPRASGLQLQPFQLLTLGGPWCTRMSLRQGRGRRRMWMDRRRFIVPTAAMLTPEAIELESFCQGKDFNQSEPRPSFSLVREASFSRSLQSHARRARLALASQGQREDHSSSELSCNLPRVGLLHPYIIQLRDAAHLTARPFGSNASFPIASYSLVQLARSIPSLKLLCESDRSLLLWDETFAPPSAVSAALGQREVLGGSNTRVGQNGRDALPAPDSAVSREKNSTPTTGCAVHRDSSMNAVSGNGKGVRAARCQPSPSSAPDTFTGTPQPKGNVEPLDQKTSVIQKINSSTDERFSTKGPLCYSLAFGQELLGPLTLLKKSTSGFAGRKKWNTESLARVGPTPSLSKLAAILDTADQIDDQPAGFIAAANEKPSDKDDRAVTPRSLVPPLGTVVVDDNSSYRKSEPQPTSLASSRSAAPGSPLLSRSLSSSKQNVGLLSWALKTQSGTASSHVSIPFGPLLPHYLGYSFTGFYPTGLGGLESSLTGSARGDLDPPAFSAALALDSLAHTGGAGKYCLPRHKISRLKRWEEQQMPTLSTGSLSFPNSASNSTPSSSMGVHGHGYTSRRPPPSGPS